MVKTGAQCGSINNEGGWVSGVIRISDGRWHRCFLEEDVTPSSINNKDSIFPKSSEALAIKESTTFAVKRHLKYVILEEDSQAIFGATQGNMGPSCFLCIIESIKNIFKAFDNVLFNWVPRDVNRAAHDLALFTPM